MPRSVTNAAFEVGDSVKLKDGNGPRMIIVRVYDSFGETSVRCAWFAGNKHQEASFPPEALIRVQIEEERK